MNAFLAREIPFSGIVKALDRALSAFSGCGDTLEEILDADLWARSYVRDAYGIRPVG